MTLQCTLYSMLKKEGQAVEMIRKIRRAPEYKRARIDIRSTRRKDLKRLVIGIGQIHPVMRGKFTYGQARQIGKVQAWIFEACQYLQETFGVHSFGQEGFSASDAGMVIARLDSGLIRELEQAIDHHDDIQKVLLKSAQAWRRSLKFPDKEARQEAVTKLNGLAILQATHPRITFFPIEQGSVHGVIGENLKRLQKEMGALQTSSAYQSYRRKGGKNLTKDEYAVAVQHNTLVKEFNRMIKHPDRERSILREVLKHADRPVTVFILGQGHRHQFLRLAKTHLPDDALFAWITPPQLWWRQAMVRRAGVILLLGILGTLASYVFVP